MTLRITGYLASVSCVFVLGWISSMHFYQKSELQTDSNSVISDVNSLHSGVDRNGPPLDASILATPSLIEKRARMLASGEVSRIIEEHEIAQRRILDKKLFESLALKDPAMAAEFLDQLPLEDQAYPALFLARAWAKSAPVEAMNWVMSRADENGMPNRNDFLSVLPYLANIDPLLAQSYVARIPDGETRGQAILRLCSFLIAKDDFGPAFDWVAKLKNPRDTKIAYGRAMDAYMSKYPKDAASLILEMDSSRLKQKFVKKFSASAYKTLGIEGSLDWISNLGDPTIADIALNNIVYDWTLSAPLESLEFIRSQMSEKNKSAHFERALTQLLLTDQEIAVEAFEGLEYDSKMKVGPGFVGALRRENPAESRRIALSLPEGEGRDRAIARVATSPYGELHQGFDDAALIKSEQLRSSVLRELIYTQQAEGPLKLQDAIRISRLRYAEKEQLIAQLEVNASEGSDAEHLLLPW